jgi:hypothetical protein
MTLPETAEEMFLVYCSTANCQSALVLDGIGIGEVLVNPSQAERTEHDVTSEQPRQMRQPPNRLRLAPAQPVHRAS